MQSTKLNWKIYGEKHPFFTGIIYLQYKETGNVGVENDNVFNLVNKKVIIAMWQLQLKNRKI